RTRTCRGSHKAKGGINESVGCRRHWRDWTSIGLRTSGKGARSDRDEQLRKWTSKPAREGRGGRSGALDENAVLALVRRVKPNAVIEELPSLPKRYTPEEMRTAADRDRNLRLVGGRNSSLGAQDQLNPRFMERAMGIEPTSEAWEASIFSELL